MFFIPLLGLRLDPEPLVSPSDSLDDFRRDGFKILRCLRQVKPLFQEGVLDRIREFPAYGVMERMLSGNQQAVPWLLCRTENKHKAPMEINRAAPEPCMLDITGFFHDGIDYPEERIFERFTFFRGHRRILQAPSHGRHLAKPRPWRSSSVVPEVARHFSGKFLGQFKRFAFLYKFAIKGSNSSSSRYEILHRHSKRGNIF